MTNFDDYLAELMKKPSFKKEYDALAPEFLPLINGSKNRGARKKRTQYSQHQTSGSPVKYIPLADLSDKLDGDCK